MRKVFLFIVAVLCLLLIVPLAQSQVLSAPVRTTVQQDFYVGNLHMPAGEYVFSFDSSTSRMYIANLDTGERISVFTRDVDQPPGENQDKLVFAKDGDKLVLHRVWSTQAGHVHDLVHGTEVRELK